MIVGLANYDTINKRIFAYEGIRGEAYEIKAKNINAYLIDVKDILVEKKKKPICNLFSISVIKESSRLMSIKPVGE